MKQLHNGMFCGISKKENGYSWILYGKGLFLGPQHREYKTGQKAIEAAKRCAKFYGIVIKKVDCNV